MASAVKIQRMAISTVPRSLSDSPSLFSSGKERCTLSLLRYSWSGTTTSPRKSLRTGSLSSMRKRTASSSSSVTTSKRSFQTGFSVFSFTDVRPTSLRPSLTLTNGSDVPGLLDRSFLSFASMPVAPMMRMRTVFGSSPLNAAFSSNHSSWSAAPSADPAAASVCGRKRRFT